MYQNKKLATILLRNEDWLISRILNSANDYKQPGFQSLINHPWRKTIKEFSATITRHSENTEIYTGESILMNIEDNDFSDFARCEAENCLQRSIPPHVYLAFLKIIRKAYDQLIIESRLSTAEKKDFHVLTTRSFDYLEIAFISSCCDIEKEKNIIGKAAENTGPLPYEIIFENIPLPLLLLDPMHKIANHNREAKKLFPFLFIDGQKNPKGLLNFDEKDIFNSKIDEFRISKQKEDFFETSITINNHLHQFMVNLRKIRESELVIAGFLDITARKDLEEKLKTSKTRAEESDRLKTAFLANMSHEIRTPMNAIVGFAELLTLTDPNQQERHEYFSLIKKSSNDLLNIIEDIIDIAKIESKQLKVNPKNTSPYEILSDVGAIYSEILLRYEKDHIELRINVPENEKKLLCRTDPKRLKQVLSNLVGNAIKFTEKGKIEIGYKLAENKILYFFVKDTGIGIPYNMQKRIFDQFVQVEEAYDKNTNGTGLGLAICKNIVNLLGGNIWVTSQPDKGSNFYFYLPYIAAGEKPETKAIKETPKALVKNSLSNYCVLIAEDEESNFLYLRETLKQTGVKVLWARNGMEAISIVENNPSVNLILMDLKMPEVNGLEAARYISHIKPSLPIIAQTAFAMDTDKQACIDAGCTDYLTKPLAKEKLVGTIQKYLIASNTGATV
ncbi:MAG: response regulator [Bacteroidales bacterium]|nr:response regulator [Bacteroidales bacterium]